VLDLGSEGVAEAARGPAFLENHLAGFESNCENPEGEVARGNVVVDVVVMGERSCGLRAWGCVGLRRERIVGASMDAWYKEVRVWQKSVRRGARCWGHLKVEDEEQERRIHSAKTRAWYPTKPNGTLSGGRKSRPKRDKYTRDTPI
jgi:hypothetical protein